MKYSSALWTLFNRKCGNADFTGNTYLKKDDSDGVLRGTLDVLVLKALSWGSMHGFEVTAWIERSADGSMEVDDSAVRISNTGIQYTPVDSMAIVVIPTLRSHSARRCKSPVKLRNVRTGSSLNSAETATT